MALFSSFFNLPMLRASLAVKKTTTGFVTKMNTASCQCIQNNTNAENKSTKEAIISLEIVLLTKLSMVSTSVTNFEVTAPTLIISYSLSETLLRWFNKDCLILKVIFFDMVVNILLCSI